MRLFQIGRDTNFCKFAGDVTYKTQKSKTNLHSIHTYTRTSIEGQSLRSFSNRDARRTTSVLPLVTSPHFNGHRQLWYVTRGGGPRSFKPYPVERDSVKQARGKRTTLLFAILKINNRKPYSRWRTARRTKSDKPILRALSLLVCGL